MTSAVPFRERLAQIRANEAANAPAESPNTQPLTPQYHDEADVPVVDQDSGVSQERLELDQVLAGIGIKDAYVRWCGKNHENFATNKVEGVKISCPFPDHPDNDPSAWLNTDTNLWFCGGCQAGGDMFDIASFKFGFNYQTDPAAFVDLKKAMAADLGYTVKRSLGGTNYVEKTATWVEETPDVESAPTTTSAAPSTEATPIPVIPPTVPAQTQDLAPPAAPIITSEPTSEPSLPAVTATAASSNNSVPVKDPLEGDPNYPTLDWRDLIEPGTFLDVWMTEMVHDTLPEEYYFWLGMMGIGAAVGRNGRLEHGTNIYPNLLCCLVGATGIGKSRSSARLNQLLTKALPYDHDNPFTTGVKHVPVPGSGEVLQKHFSCPIVDPNDPKRIAGYAPVKGLVDFDEFSNLTTRSARMGSTLQQTLMRLFDGYVDTTSMGSLTHGIAVVEQPFAMGLATTQPRSIQHLVGKFDKSSGFLNRWFFVTGNAKTPLAFQTHKFDLDLSVNLLKQIHSWSVVGTGRNLDWSPEGRAAYEAFFNARIRQTQGAADPTDGLLSRLEVAALKVMLMLAANEKTVIISAEIVRKMTVIYDYLEETYMFVDGLVGNHEDVPVQDAIVETIRKHIAKYSKPIKKRELFKARMMKEFGADKIVRVMKNMSELGFLEEVLYESAKGPKWTGYKLTDIVPES